MNNNGGIVGFREERGSDSNNASKLIFAEIVDRFPGLAVRNGVYTIISQKSFENSCCFQWVSE